MSFKKCLYHFATITGMCAVIMHSPDAFPKPCDPPLHDAFQVQLTPEALREQAIRFRNLIHSSLAKYFSNRDGDWLVLPFTGIRIRHQVLWDVITSPSREVMLEQLINQADLLVVIVKSSSPNDSKEELKPIANSLLITEDHPHYHAWLEEFIIRKGVTVPALYACHKFPSPIQSTSTAPISPQAALPNHVLFVHPHALLIRSDANRMLIAHEFVHHLQDLIKTYPELHPEVVVNPYEFIIRNSNAQEAETHLLTVFHGLDLLDMQPDQILHELRTAIRYLHHTNLVNRDSIILDLEKLHNKIYQEFNDFLWTAGPNILRDQLDLLNTLPITPKLFIDRQSDDVNLQMAVLEQLWPYKNNPAVVNLLAAYAAPRFHATVRKKVISLLGKWPEQGVFALLKQFYEPNEEDRDIRREFHRTFRKLYGRAATADPDLAANIQAYCREIGVLVGSDVSPDHKAAYLAGRVFDEETEEGKRLVLTEIETALPSLLKIGDELIEALQISGKNYPPLQEQIDRIAASATAGQLLGLPTPDIQWFLLKKPPLDRNQTVREFLSNPNALPPDTLASCIRMLRDTGTELDAPILLDILPRSKNPRLSSIVVEALTTIKDRIATTAPETAAVIAAATTPPSLGQRIKGFLKRFK